MNDREILSRLFENTINDMNDTIDGLYAASRISERNALLGSLRKQLASLALLVQGVQKPAGSAADNTAGTKAPEGQKQPSELSRTFTPAELAGYTGKNGRPAYVAVDGIVYDMTEVAAWAGATHFGLTPGKDLTAQLASCHAGQHITDKLTAVGMMAE